MDLLGIVHHLAYKHAVFFGGIHPDSGGAWRPTSARPLALSRASFISDDQLRSWATDTTVANTIYAPDIPQGDVIELPPLGDSATIIVPVDMHRASPSFTDERKLDPWRLAASQTAPPLMISRRSAPCI